MVLAEERSAELAELRDAGLGGRLSITEGYNFLTDGLGPGVTGVCQTSPQHGTALQSPQPRHSCVESRPSQPAGSPTSDFSHLVGFFPCHVFKYVDLIRLTKASLDAKFLTDFYD